MAIYILESSTDNGKHFKPVAIDGYGGLSRCISFSKKEALYEMSKYQGFTKNFRLRISKFTRKEIVGKKFYYKGNSK